MRDKIDYRWRGVRSVPVRKCSGTNGMNVSQESGLLGLVNPDDSDAVASFPLEADSAQPARQELGPVQVLGCVVSEAKG